jgi:hypothetical protein
MPSPVRGWWRGMQEAERRALLRFYRGLEARYGAFDQVARQHARLTTEAWWNARQASEVALVESAKRRHGRGRRPSGQAVERQMKRAGLNVGTFDQMVRRLEELTSGAKRDLGRALRERLG